MKNIGVDIRHIVKALETENWEYAMMYITDEFLKPYGICRYQEDVETVLVNQDEILFPEIQESILDI